MMLDNGGLWYDLFGLMVVLEPSSIHCFKGVSKRVNAFYEECYANRLINEPSLISHNWVFNYYPGASSNLKPIKHLKNQPVSFELVILKSVSKDPCFRCQYWFMDQTLLGLEGGPVTIFEVSCNGVLYTFKCPGKPFDVPRMHSSLKRLFKKQLRLVK